MTLKREVYQALEDIVGPDNASMEPAILDSYTKVWGVAIVTGKPRLPRPGAVVLPESTEEVQMIVKACNRYKVKFKALSTGWIFAISPGADGLQIDLRRMNRILEINEKNMYAVVEPYVIGAQLQAELMKKGLTCNVIGAGSNTTMLAPAKCSGAGHSGVTTSYDCRNQLAVEWVLPTGDVLRLGSLGGEAGWFYGDGPGPSLRGVTRGNLGAYGGIGIFTKAAIKLYHWPGPRVPVIEGVSPYYRFKASENLKLHCISFSSWERCSEALHKISESEMALVFARLAPWMLAFNIGTNNQEAVELLSKIEKSLNGRIAWVIIIAGDTKNEFEYKEKVLKKIKEETVGESFDLIEDSDIADGLLWRILRVTRSNSETFRASGVYFGTMAGTDALLPAVQHMAHDTEIKKRLIAEGLIINDGGDNNWGVCFEGGHFYHLEQLVLHTETPESIDGMRFLGKKSRVIAVEKHYPLHTGTGDEAANFYGPHVNNYQLWARKIKKAFDPNLVSESTFYFTPDE